MLPLASRDRAAVEERAPAEVAERAKQENLAGKVQEDQEERAAPAEEVVPVVDHPPAERTSQLLNAEAQANLTLKELILKEPTSR